MEPDYGQINIGWMWIVHLKQFYDFFVNIMEKKSHEIEIVFLKVNSEESLAALVSIVSYSLLDEIKIAKYCEKFLYVVDL